MKRFGFTRQGWQRHRCKVCRRTHSDIPERPLDALRVDLDKAVQVIHLLVEGVGIRAAARLTSLNERTVLNVLRVAGEKCARLLDTKVRDIEVDSVQADEIWCRVFCKQSNNTFKRPDIGDQFTYLGICRTSKLILSHWVGKRDYGNTLQFVRDLKKRVRGRFQLTTDQWQGYVRAVYETFYADIDFAQQQKVYAPDLNGSSNMTARRYSPPKCIDVKTMIHIGVPAPEKISTSHVERTNLSIRLFNRRFTRLTMGYSKKIENLRHSVALLVAHFNFCRVHSAHGMTPAQAAGLTDRQWTITELLQS